MFPVYGSMTLFGLYAVFKFFDKDYVNLLLKAYFLLLGVVAMAATLHPFAKDEFKRFVSGSRFKSLIKTHKFEKKIPILGDLFKLDNLKIEGDIVLAFCGAISLVVASTYIYSKHWCFNNILGICFSIQGIENIGLSSVKVGVIVLVC
jgi:minor histocompatibility antigen H13